DHTVSGATRSTACSWAGPVLRWALTVRGSLPRWRHSRYKTFSAVISWILTRMPSNLDAPLKTYLDHLARGELAYQFSPEAGPALFYPRMLCPFTGSDRLEWRISKGLGTVYATTVSHRGQAVQCCADRLRRRLPPDEPGGRHRAGAGTHRAARRLSRASAGRRGAATARLCPPGGGVMDGLRRQRGDCR